MTLVCSCVSATSWVSVYPSVVIFETASLALPVYLTHSRISELKDVSVVGTCCLLFWAELQESVGEGNGTPLQYSCLENPMDGGAWQAAVHGVARVGHDWAFTFHFQALEKEMATHSSVLAWRIPGTGKPGGLPSMGSHRVRHVWSDLAAAAAGGCSTVLPSVVCSWARPLGPRCVSGKPGGMSPSGDLRAHGDGSRLNEGRPVEGLWNWWRPFNS